MISDEYTAWGAVCDTNGDDFRRRPLTDDTVDLAGIFDRGSNLSNNDLVVVRLELKRPPAGQNSLEGAFQGKMLCLKVVGTNKSGQSFHFLGSKRNAFPGQGERAACLMLMQEAQQFAHGGNRGR